MKLFGKLSLVLLTGLAVANCNSDSDDSNVQGIGVAGTNGSFTFYTSIKVEKDSELSTPLESFGKYEWCVYSAKLSGQEKTDLEQELKNRNIPLSWMSHFAFIKATESGVTQETKKGISRDSLKAALKNDENAVSALLDPSRTEYVNLDNREIKAVLESAQLAPALDKSTEPAKCGSVNFLFDRLAEVQNTVESATPESVNSDRLEDAVVTNESFGTTMSLGTGSVVDVSKAFSGLGSDSTYTIDNSNGSIFGTNNSYTPESTTVETQVEEYPTTSPRNPTEGLFDENSRTFQEFRKRQKAAKQKDQRLEIQPASSFFALAK